MAFLVDSDFLKVLHSRLKPLGVVEFATDDFQYFDHVKRELAVTRLGWQNVRDSVNGRLIYETTMTTYESKYRDLGKSVYYLEIQK